MWTFLWGLVQPRLLAGLKWVGIAAAVAAVLFTAKRAGRNAERVGNLERSVDAAKKASRIEARNQALDGSDAAVRERMRQQRSKFKRG